eukprot:CAMPEP_0185583192 /NCGR_PEP_ID=MMETSP0434-20130131/21372_1 /TAXON_ID=626734 ORGANISM="Favella taraikaensis, Strain Fe Narragansett Bay" /NCGR_SAMPLE_ID=MMETSP0434 /ASSEMBLY_ACC=CAM_ASM_000379 /LENGTH=166 /DNA_ID=CAMNT_0028202203 /DNA_START=6 /DNA_END=506 /DNA_ORIENTATION=-
MADTVYRLKGKTGIHAMPISPEQVDELRQAFELFIPDKQTTVKPYELLNCFERLGLNESRKAMYEMIQSMSTSVNNELGLTFEEFLDLAATYFNKRDTHEGLSRIFKLFDNTERGRLTKKDMRRISNELDLYLKSEEIELIFSRASTDGEYITLEDFMFHMRVQEM